MSRPGRLLRELMRPDAPGAAEERIRRRKACEQANAEMMARFAPIDSVEKAQEAIRWQEARIEELGGNR